MDIRMLPTALAALQNAFERYTDLGESGKEQVHKNQFGDTTLRGDVEAEEAVISVLKQSNLPFIINSEEHGKVQLGENPQYLVVLDGIDGSAWYKKDWQNGRYGTMLGVYQGVNPSYHDYLFGGIMEHTTQRLFYGYKGKGSHILDLKTSLETPIHTSGTKNFDTQTEIHIDEYWDINNAVFTSKLSNYNVLKYHFCSAVHYADVAMGKADLTLECTRKGNLEIAAAYPLIREAGGAMLTLEGHELDNEKYLDFGQNEHKNVITASTATLATSAKEFFLK